MKKALSMILAAIMVLSLAACGGGQESSSTPEPDQSASTGETYTIIIGGTGSDQTGDYACAEAFKEYVEANSNGQIEVQLMFNGILGSDREILESVQLGSCTVVGTGLTQNTNFVPELTVLDSPFMFENADDVTALFADEEFVAELNDAYAQAGYKYMGMTFQGFRTLTSNKEIHSMSDMKGMTIRVIESATPLALWSALGANPTPLAFTEVYTALQQGTVDAQENPLELIYSQKFYEQQKYIINTNHQIQPIFWVMNLSFYNNLPADLQSVVDEGTRVGLAASETYSADMAATYEETMRDYGCTFIDITSEAHDEMYAATQAVRDDLAAQYPDFAASVNAAVERTQG